KDASRACIHGQSWRDSTVLRCTGYGLGAEGRQFGGHMHATGEWQSDYGWLSAPATQWRQTIRPGHESSQEIAYTLACLQTSEPTLDETYVSNLEMCRVVVEECCRGTFTGSVICDLCEDDDTDDGINQDLSDTEVQTACPLGASESSIPPDSASTWVHITQGWNTYVEIAEPNGQWFRGDSVARNLWSDGLNREIHPDAEWSQLNDILNAVGCIDVMVAGSPLRDDTCDHWPCDESVVIYCDDTRPPACNVEPCGHYYIHTVLEDNQCHCSDERGDGVCAISRGENMLNSPDCGPAYCGDGYCNGGSESFETCPEDCAEIFCGDGFCHAREEFEGSCDADCGPPGNYQDFRCTESGYAEMRAEVFECGDGSITHGESCQLCRQDGTGGPYNRYGGLDECQMDNSGYPQRYFTTHACINRECLETSAGGWCEGWCDDDEGCIPPPLGPPVNCDGLAGLARGVSCSAPLGAARDASFTMVVDTSGSITTTGVRARNYFTDETLDEQRTREEWVSSGIPFSLLRIWEATAPNGQKIYTILPSTPDPFTLQPKARLDATGLDVGVFNGLATIPGYSQPMLGCLDASHEDPDVDPTLWCLDQEPEYHDTGVDATVDGHTCRIFEYGSPEVTICVPEPCPLRRTLFPLRVTGPNTVVEFLDLAVDEHEDNVVVEPSPCGEPVPSLILCDHPDLSGM
ncbi:MAG: hypothetical protein KC561_13185, partial [Myxococcales bacterium]|nr:hypothetical protein [Myxococcales bacterium]